jgi:UDP-glucose 4-epimerase
MMRAAYQGAPVLILGASGFIGSWVVRVLARQGAQLHLASRRALDPDVRALAASGQRLDLLANGAVEELVRQTAPRWIFNLAGYGVDPREQDETLSSRVNAELPCRLARAARRQAERGPITIVHAGSMAEYGPVAGKVREDLTPNPTTLYGRTKLAGTLALSDACRDGVLHGVTARLFMVYGPGERPGRLFPSLLETARSRHPLDLTAGTQRRDFTFVEEAAEGLVRLGATQSRGEPVNLATGRLQSVREFAEATASILGIPPGLLRFGALPSNVHDLGHGEVVIARLKRLTSWSPSLSIEQGIRRSLPD